MIKPKLRPLNLLPLTVLIGSWLTLNAQQMPPQPVRYTEAREHPVKRTVRLPGTVEALRTSTVASEIAGAVLELAAREGTRVGKGTVLARLRQDQHDLALRAAEAQLQEDQAREKLAERNLERTRQLFSTHDVSQRQLDDAQFEFNAWQGRIAKQKAEIDRIKDDLDRHIIRAPFSGVVVREHVEVGEWVALGGPVVELLASDQLEVTGEVPERYFSTLRVGSRTPVTFEALGGLQVAGRVSAIVPRADPQARTFRIKVRIPNPKSRIGVGMLAQIALPGSDSYRATVVPKDAIVTKGAQQFVYLVNGNNTISEVLVETGAGVGSWIEVQGPVEAGYRVVTRGNERLMPGQPVQGQPLEVPLP